MHIEVAGQTDVGRKRAHNEDNFAIIGEFGLYIVADGMGWPRIGRGRASKMAVDTMREFFATTADDPEQTWPYKMDRGRGYEENRPDHRDQAEQPAHFSSPPSKTLSSAEWGRPSSALRDRGRGFYVAHVGDSRDLIASARARSNSSPRITRCSTTTRR